MASGNGTNAENLILKSREAGSRYQIVCIVTDTDGAFVGERAKKYHIPFHVVAKKKDESKIQHEQKLLAVLKKHQVQLVCLAGYMRILSPHFLREFNKKGEDQYHVINIHPSYLPDFPGLEAYHQAFVAKVPFSGVSVHYVDEGVDTGPIIKQEKFERLAGDEYSDFERRGREVESHLYPLALAELCEHFHDDDLRGATVRVKRIEIEHQYDESLSGPLIEACRARGIKFEGPALARRVYKMSEGPSMPLNCEVLKEVFCDPVLQRMFTEAEETDVYNRMIEISFRPGVTDNAGEAAREALSLYGNIQKVASGILIGLKTDAPEVALIEICEDLFANPLIQKVESISRPRDRFDHNELPLVHIEHPGDYLEISLDLEEEELLALSQNRCLALSALEMTAIKNYYANEDLQRQRRELGLPAAPSDVELEVLAQTWSEHCKHKIFSSPIDFEGQKITSLFKNYIKKATFDVIEKKGVDWAKSVFSDNAGIVRFDSQIDLCIKVETHNSPSALDPYGGAITGILGVNRDILGCGLGAKPIANTNVLCFGPTEWPNEEMSEQMPVGHLGPKKLLKGVHKGIEDGGNKSGIPTIDGAFYFDESYCGKPLVYCGTLGVIPQKLSEGRQSFEKNIVRGDLVVVAGGSVGMDGIHGATFSSLELDENSPATAVQIGDPLTQKRVLDFIIESRDQNLYRAVTDNGAGGMSSSVGEMAELSGGAEIDLKKCPLKYPGLAPYEILISESQERMTLAVPPEKFNDLAALAKKHGVQLTAIGTFTDSGHLVAYYGERIVCRLNLQFLHEGWPKVELKARWGHQYLRKNWATFPEKENRHRDDSTFFKKDLLTLLGRANITSKEDLVRRFDHEVQAASLVRSFEGEHGHGPNDGGAIWLAPHGGMAHSAAVVGNGLNPRLSDIDPYYMALCSADEAVRNVVAVGGDPAHCALLDNFCWPDPILGPSNTDGDYKLGQLVRANQGLYDFCWTYAMPLVSGKDSMKNDYRGKNGRGEEIKISVKPTLLVTALARAHAQKLMTSSFKNDGDGIFLLGGHHLFLLGSEYEQIFSLSGNDQERLAMGKIGQQELSRQQDLYKKLHQAIEEKWIVSCHDISEGGLAVSLCECALGGGLGAQIVAGFEVPERAFSEGMGSFLISVRPEQEELIEKFFANGATKIGQVKSGREIFFGDHCIELVAVRDAFYQKERWN